MHGLVLEELILVAQPSRLSETHWEWISSAQYLSPTSGEYANWWSTDPNDCDTKYVRIDYGASLQLRDTIQSLLKMLYVSMVSF